VLLRGRRYSIAPISITDVRNLFQVRRLLESETTRRAAGRVDVNELRQLDALCMAAYEPREPQSVRSFLAANTEFHITVARSSGNPRLVDMLEPVLTEMERLLYLGLRHSNRSSAIAHEHRRLINALAAENPDAAVTEMLRQINDSQAMVIQAFVDGAMDSNIH